MNLLQANLDFSQFRFYSFWRLVQPLLHEFSRFENRMRLGDNNKKIKRYQYFILPV